MDHESQPLKWVPVLSTCISLAALGFPWHIQLSNEFADLQRNCLLKGSGLN